MPLACRHAVALSNFYSPWKPRLGWIKTSVAELSNESVNLTFFNHGVLVMSPLSKLCRTERFDIIPALRANTVMCHTNGISVFHFDYGVN